MNILPGTLVCTVGTSLFYPNLERLDPDSTEMTGGPRSAAFRKCKEHYIQKDWPALGRALIRIPPDHRLCGAEINSIEAMVRKGFLGEDRVRLILLISDTEEGKAMGRVLEAYFLDPDCPVRFQYVSSRVVAGLQDAEPLRFRREGLGNLVRALGEELRKWGASSMAVNATGGYKAQIALAVAFGQAAGCPVYYKHEKFDQVIRFPQVPFALDLGLVNDLAEPDAAVPYKDILRALGAGSPQMEAMEPLLEIEAVDAERLAALSALGLVYWEAYLSQNPDKMIEPPRTAHRMGCRFPQHHYPKGFIDYVQKVYEAFPHWITGCHTLPYSGQAALNHGRFLERDRAICGEYVDAGGFGARFEVRTTARNALHRRFVLHQLNHWSKGNN
jgi:putative CRISPR-associated protein (TIGR02619 family)